MTDKKYEKEYEKDDSLSEAAKATWLSIAVLAAIIVSFALGAYLLDTGLDAAAVYGVPEADYKTCIGLLIGVVAVGWAFGLGQASFMRTKVTHPDVNIVNVVPKKEGQ